MQLTPGTELLHYRLVEKIGEGGMGVVWRAADTTLDREVAIKVLPDIFVNDPDRSARFDREAKVLASLNHPNITTVHSVHHVEDVRFLVMEFAHGENLAARIARGRMPVDEAMQVAKQIAEAIEAAHESGVVHRDLKPGNVTVSNDGKAEVLDFGLAKALDVGTGAPISDLSKSPTLASSGQTAAGIILGTAAYMSPEQARGKTVDRRTDIWAFGCVLYEMLTGSKAFDGETVTDVLAAVVTRDPDWSLIPGDTPARVRELLRRCLEKDPQRRLRDAGEIRIAIEDVLARPHSGGVEPVEAPAKPGWRERRRQRRRVWPWIVLASFAFVIAMTLIDRKPEVTTEPTHLSMNLPPGDVLDGGWENLMLAISHDGRTIAYCARRNAKQQLYVRRLGDATPTLLAGTEDAHSPFFSPDGQWVAFFAQSKLRKVSINGGPVFDVCSVAADRAGVWLDDSSIALVPLATEPVSRVPASGGAIQAVTALDTLAGERTHRWPDVLPGSDWIIYTIGNIQSPGNYEDASIGAWNLRTGKHHIVLQGASMARYCDPGFLVYSRKGALLAVAIDPSTAKVTGTAIPVLDGVEREASSGAVHFAVSRNGTLVYVPSVEGGNDADLVWVDMKGGVTPIGAPPREYNAPRVSPDGRKICVTIGPSYGVGDLWVFDIERETLQRITFDGKSLVGFWTPDQRHILCQKEDVTSTVSLLTLSGEDPPQPVFANKQPVVLSDVTGDGKWALYSPWGTENADIFRFPVAGGTPEKVVDDPFDQADAAVSPDGNWVAYTSRVDGGNSIFVRAFPAGAGRWQASSEAAFMPAWSPTRNELYWLNGAALFGATYHVTGRTISFDRPRRLFDLPPGRGFENDVLCYDVTPDGSRFVMVRSARPEYARRHVDLILNFSQELKAIEKGRQ